VIQRNRTNSSIAPFYFSDLINSNHPEMAFGEKQVLSGISFGDDLVQNENAQKISAQPSASVHNTESLTISPLSVFITPLFTVNKMTPSINVAKKLNIFVHQIKVEAGHSVKNPSSKSIALGYKFSY